MIAVMAKIYEVLYKQSSSIALMKHLVIGQRFKTPNFSAFPWSPRGSLVSIGQNFVATRVVHLPKSTETSLITESDQSGLYHQILQLCTASTVWSDSDRLCGPCIAVIAGSSQCSRKLWRKFIKCSINSHALSLLMKYLVIGQRLKTPNFSAFHWSGFDWSAFLSHEGSTFTEKYRNKFNYRIGPKRTLSPAIAAMHGQHSLVRFGPGCADRA